MPADNALVDLNEFNLIGIFCGKLSRYHDASTFITRQ